MNTLKLLQYAAGRDLAWKILIDNNVITFPVDILSLILNYNIAPVFNYHSDELLSRLSVNKDNDACAARVDEQYYIIYNPEAYPPRLRFSIAHEFGHIALGHILKDCIIAEQSPYTEEQANIFASRILAPAIVAKVENLMSAEDVSRFFGISMESATIRFKRFKELYERNKFLTSPLEKEYFEIYNLKK